MTFDVERAKEALQKNCICTDCMKYNLIEEAVTEVERLRSIVISERFKRRYDQLMQNPIFETMKITDREYADRGSHHELVKGRVEAKTIPIDAKVLMKLVEDELQDEGLL